MALVRVYCGLASADDAQPDNGGAWLTAALVDDSGRLLAVCDITDDPSGYAHLGRLLAERSTGPTGVAVAADSDDHFVTMLLIAAGRPLSFADDDSVDDFAERFCDDQSVEEIEAPQAERRAVGLARALQAGALSAVALPAPREMAALKPVLAAHAAIAVGRQATAVALREVLRELYPAALRAYPDPADTLPLAVLDALPEPGLVGGPTGHRGRDATTDAVASQIAGTGIADTAAVNEAITALRVAIAETPRRFPITRTMTAAVTGTIREAVAAVRACDAASAALIGTLSERANPPATSRPQVPRQRHAAVNGGVSAGSLATREVTAEHATVRVPLPRRSRSGPAPVSVPPAASSTSAPPAPPRVAPRSPAPPVAPAASMSPPSMPAAPVTPAVPMMPTPPPPAGIAPTAPRPASAPPQQVSPPPFRTTVTTVSSSTAEFGATDFTPPVPPQRPPANTDAPPGSRANWPLVGDADERPQESGPQELAPDPILDAPYRQNGVAPDPAQQPGGRVTPPWQADDLPPEPPMLRLVEPPPLADPALNRLSDPDGQGRLGPPPLRLVETEGGTRNGRAASRAGDARPAAAPASVPPVGDDGDSDLLIFAAARSAWFIEGTEESEPEWGIADAGWRAAEQAARPAVSVSTEAGLPKRVPQANLVPGSPTSAPDRPLRIVRDAASIAQHTSGYFNGWRRGQQISGYAVGGRPGRESAQGWDFSRDPGDDDKGYEYPATAYHSR